MAYGEDAPTKRRVVTIPYLKEKKAKGEPITMLTAYDYPMAVIEDNLGIDIILCGDSLGMTVYGYKGTVPVTMDQMLAHSRALKLIADAKVLEEAGAFSILLEAIPPEIGKIITERARIPIIGIGAGAYTDGQVLVVHDALGFFDGHVAKFVKQYANLNQVISDALKNYMIDVIQRTYPAPEHCYGMDSDILEEIKKTMTS